MSHRRYFEASLRPPPPRRHGSEDSWDWGEALIDKSAYLVDSENHTSACCRFARNKDGKEMEMRVTLCFAPPPRISYFCVAYTDGEDTCFASEPKMIAAEGNLALIALTHGHTFLTDSINYDYFLYLASSSSSPAATLTRLPHVHPDMFPSKGSRRFPADEIGILRYGSTTFKIATLAAQLRFEPTRYYLCTYDSKAGAWNRNPTDFSQPPPPNFPSDYSCERVVDIGGGGIMGWVDLWKGMLLCNVLADTCCTLLCLHYVSLPEPRQPRNCLPLFNCSSVSRDIAVVKDDIIKFVDLQVHTDPSPGSQIPNGWTVVTWTMEIHGDLETLGDLSFRQEHELHSRDIANYELPQSLFVSYPVLSSHNDGILYLRTSVSLDDMKSQVIAVDIKEKLLLAVDDFDQQRPTTYMRTTISSYLTPPVSKEKMKRRSWVSLGSSRKKPQPQPAITRATQRKEWVMSGM